MTVVGLEETDEEKRLRAAACLLADIGWRAHPDYRGEQSLNIITNAAFVGIDHPGRAYLALAIYYRHAGLTDEELGAGLRELAPLRYRESARALAGALRVAYLVSGAVEGVLPRTQDSPLGKRRRACPPGGPGRSARRSSGEPSASVRGACWAARHDHHRQEVAIRRRSATRGRAPQRRRRCATWTAPARHASAPAPARRKAAAASRAEQGHRHCRQRRSSPGRRCWR